MTKNEKKRIILTLLLMFIISISVCSLFICTHDDYYVPYGDDFLGSVTFAEKLGNGRYLGNFFGNWFSQKYVVSVVLRSISFVLLPWLMSYLTGTITWNNLLLAFFLVLFPGVEVLSQSYGWAHGFYNYVPVVVFSFSAAALLKSPISIKHRAFSIIVLNLLGMGQMLFSENSSVVCFVWSLWLCVEYKEDGKRLLLAITYTIAGIVGIGIMFFGPRISGVAENMLSYRGISSDIIATIKSNTVEIFQTVIQALILWLSWITLLLFKRNTGSKVGKALSAVLLLLWIFAYSVSREYFSKSIFQSAGIVCTVLFFLILLVYSVILFDSSVLQKAGVPFILAIISAGELLVVQPVGPRCMYITVIMLSFSLLYLLNDSKRKKEVYTFGFVIGVICLFLTLFHLIPVFCQNKIRIQNIKNQMNEGNKIIEVVPIKETKYVWNANELYGYPYTFNYGDPDEVVFTLVKEKE